MRDAHWIFGYGSLMWHPGFEFSENRPAAITGWIRRFWQGSTNHRGVPGAPGRVVSLVPDESAVCRGMAYRVDSKAYRAAVETLRAREQGYVGVPTSIVLDGTPRHADRGLVFIANPDNPSFLGPAPLIEIASQVHEARGPSGSNTEYVTQLAEVLRDLNSDDPHVFELERLVVGGDGASDVV